MPVPTWPRPHFQPGGLPADLDLQIFSRAALPEALPIHRDRHGLPAGDPPAGIYLTELSIEDAPDWFLGFHAEPLLGPARRALGDELPALLGARACFELAGEEPEPRDLAYLQHAWGLVRCLCELGAGPVYDVHARRWWRRADLLALAPTRTFDLRREVSVEQREAGGGRVLFTRGLAKFGRDDLVLPAAGPEDEVRIEALARALAEGLSLEPGLALEGDDGARLRFERYAPGGGLPDLDLSNEALLIRR